MAHDRASTTATFPAMPATPRRMRTVLRRRGAADRVPEEAVDDLAIAVTEAANNALRHSATDTIDLTWRVADERVEVEVRDGGVFRHELPIPPHDRAGWGLRLMAAVSDEVALHPGTPEHPGTSVRLVKSWSERSR